MKRIRKSSALDGDIDILVYSLSSIKKYFIKKGFFYVPYLGRTTGFFMKKLTIKGLITYHLQDNIFFIYKNQLILIDGFEKLILMSSENYDYMLYIMKIFFEKKIKPRYIDSIEEFYGVTIEQLDLSNEIDMFIKKHQLRIVKKNIRFNFFYKKMNRLKFFFYPRFIGITGLDGTGKSTTIAELKSIMGHNVEIVYMGKKEWQTMLAQKFLTKKRLPSILNILILYVEFWYRILKTFRSTKVILFDRYPSEMYLTQKGIRKKVYYILFNILFPKPCKNFYLHCQTDISLSRKDDIEDINEFIFRKKVFDKHYRKSIWINTETLNLPQVIENIFLNLNSKILEML